MPPTPAPADAGVTCRPQDLSKMEPIFHSLLPALFSFLQRGSIVDSGAHFGGEACMYAKLSPTRKVHAIEPLASNVERIRKNYKDLPNLRVTVGGLASRPFSLNAQPAWGRPFDARDRAAHYFMTMLINTHNALPSPARATANESAAAKNAINFFTLDARFRQETLAFLHLDVEGAELDVLRGGAAVLARDAPLLSTEVHVFDNVSYTRELLQFTHTLGFDAYMIDEDCGTRLDCRNILHVPRATVTEALRAWLQATPPLRPVTARSIFSACNCTLTRAHV